MTTNRFNSNRGRHPQTLHRTANGGRYSRRPIREGLKITCGLDSFTPYGRAAEETYSRISEAGRLNDLDVCLEDSYPEGLSNVELNDILQFDQHWVYTSLVGMIDNLADYRGVMGEVYKAISNLDLPDDVYVFSVEEFSEHELDKILVSRRNGGVQSLIDMISSICKPFGDKVIIETNDGHITTPHLHSGMVTIRENEGYVESLRSRHIIRRPIGESRSNRYTYRYRR